MQLGDSDLRRSHLEPAFQERGVVAETVTFKSLVSHQRCKSDIITRNKHSRSARSFSL